MNLKHFIVALFVALVATTAASAEQIGRGRVELMRDETFEQNLRWEASADKKITPAKVIRWMRGLRGHVAAVPSNTEFQPIFDAHNGHIRIVATIAYKF